MSNFSRSQQVSKPAVVSPNGIVAAQHRGAAEVGAQVLADGGNAIDAAIATSFAIGVLEPWMSGLGGGGYMVVQKAGAEKAQVVDFGMKSPAGIDPADFPLSGGVASDLFPWPAVLDDRNILGPTAIAVPGVVDGMRVALETFGTFKWERLVAPAVALAERGLLVDWYAQLIISGVAKDLRRFEKSSATFLDADGYPLASAWTALAQKRADQSSYAKTLKSLAAHGPRSFYEGDIADAIDRDMRALGGSLRGSDLAAYQARVVDAKALDHGGGVVHITPELTAGPTLARFYDLVAASGVDRTKPSADLFGAFADALFTAYAERLDKMGDVEGARGCTTHFNVVDKDGTMVAVTQTLLSIFGSRVMLPESGILMNNGIMWFDPEPNKPNSLAPDKKCLSNMCPIIAERADGYRFAIGASGGRKIMPAVAQLSSLMLECGYNLEDAFHAPRIDVSGGDTVVMDETLPQDVRDALEKRFTAIAAPRTVYPYNFACPSGVARTADQNQGATEIMSPWGDAVIGE